MREAIDDLARSGITPEQATALGMYPVDSARKVHLSFARAKALAIPYFDHVTGEAQTYGDHHLPYVRVRYLEDVRTTDGRLLRYTQPAGSPVRVYFPRVTDWAAIRADYRVPIVITEGEKKAAAACLAGIPTIGLGGVYNFRDKKGSGLATDLLPYVTKGRLIIIAYDSDAVRNPQVAQAELALAGEIHRRFAGVRLARLTDTADERKRGLDDYLATGLRSELVDVLLRAQPIPTLDLEVMRLNEEIAYMESEDEIMTLREGNRLSKASLLSGSRWSSQTATLLKIVGGAPVPKKVQIAPLWLRHPGARRYVTTTFNPGVDGRDVMTPSGLKYNTWTGLVRRKGDVQPFLDLTDHLMSASEPEVRDFPLKLLAYKAQNPWEKIPLAIVFVGPPGSGKSTWPDIVLKAFAPYGNTMQVPALLDAFNEWRRHSLVIVIDEAKGADIDSARAELKHLISQPNYRSNEKFVKAEQAQCYNLVIINSNDRAVGSYDDNDRRMFVVGAPEKGPPELYDAVYQWSRNDGPAYLMDWLLSYDLKGWRPPKNAPLTREKLQAASEGRSVFAALAYQMQTANSHIVASWIDAAMAWAQKAQSSPIASVAQRGREVWDLYSTIHIRPWYTPEELTKMFPALVEQHQNVKGPRLAAAGILSRELRNHGVEFLKSTDDARGFWHNGELRQYLIVAEQESWREPISQEDFDAYMSRWPTYEAARRLQGHKR